MLIGMMAEITNPLEGMELVTEEMDTFIVALMVGIVGTVFLMTGGKMDFWHTLIRPLHERSSKTDDTWLDCDANDHFVWNRDAVQFSESLSPTSVNTFNGSDQILGHENVRFSFDGGKVTLVCKHNPDFDLNVVSLSTFIEDFNTEFVSTHAF